MIISGWILLVVAFVAIVCFINQLNPTKRTNSSVTIVSVIVFVVAGSAGAVMLTSDDSDRCNELIDQHKDALLVNQSCWVGIGNGMYVEDGAKYYRIYTREELLQGRL